MGEVTAPRLRGPLADALQAQRERCNAAFAQARHLHPRLDAAAFADHLCGRLAPIIDAVAAVAPARVPDVTTALYDLSLEMMGADLLRRPEIDGVWQRLLPTLPRQVSESPRRLTAALSNAAMQVATVGAERAASFVEAMRGAGEGLSLDALLTYGQVLAWRKGLAHYRESALEAALSLPADVAARALGVGPTRADTHRLLEDLHADRWLDPSVAPAPAPSLKLMARAGAFRGFGGLFRRPPIIRTADDQLYAIDGDTTWLLCADVFGATFHRVGPINPSKAASPFALDGDGNVRRGRDSRRMAVLANASSWAATEDLLAVTLPTSHQIFLVAHTRG